MQLTIYAPLTYNISMIFIETPLFTKLIPKQLSDESYAEFQQVLIFRPDAGRLIPGGGGLRKIRWRTSNSGKRGGLRIIYYWDAPNDIIYLLLIYQKSHQKDLSPTQLRTLRNLVKEWLS